MDKQETIQVTDYYWSNEAVERGLIGCLVHSSENVAALQSWFTDWREVLSGVAARNVCDAAQQLYSRGVEWSDYPHGATLITGELIRLGIREYETLGYVDGAADAAPTAHNFPFWAKILADLAEKRWRQEKLAELQKQAAELTAEQFQAALVDLTPPRSEDSGPQSVSALADQVIEEADKKSRHESPARIRTGYRMLDAKLGGLLPSHLVILAARPSAGKSSFALNLTRNIATQRVPSGIVSLEMDAPVLTQWLIAQCGRLERSALRDSLLTKEDSDRLAKGRAALVKLPIYIDDKPGLDLGKVKGQMRTLAKDCGCQVLLVDYLQRISARQEDRYHETTEVAKQLKEMARSLEVPVIALTQLNRAIEKENRGPRLSDLRDSGAIEENADVVMFLHRDHSTPLEQEPLPMQLVVAKNRTGQIGLLEVSFDRKCGIFEEENVGKPE